MPFQRQTLQQLIGQVRGGFPADLAGADLALRRSNLGVSAVLIAALADGE